MTRGGASLGRSLPGGPSSAPEMAPEIVPGAVSSLGPPRPQAAEAPGEALLGEFAHDLEAKGHPTPPFWANPHAYQLDHLLKDAPRGAMAEQATHAAIHAGGKAVVSGSKAEHDDAKTLHRLAAEEHRSFCRNFSPATAEHSNRLADLHDLAAAWHAERGSVFAKPEDFLTSGSTDAFYLKSYGSEHPPQRVETDQLLAGTHEVRDGKHKLKVPEDLQELHRQEARVIRKEHMRQADNPQGNPHSSAAWDLSAEGDHRNAQEAHEIAAGHYKSLARKYQAQGQLQDAISADEGADAHDKAAVWHKGKRLGRWNLSQEVDPRPGNYYVSAIDGQRSYLVAGPWPSHAQALDKVREVMDFAIENDRSGRAHFMSWGTTRSEMDDVRKTPLGRFGGADVDPIDSYPKHGLGAWGESERAQARAWGRRNHEKLSNMANQASVKADASNSPEDHREAAKLHDYARHAHLYAREADETFGSAGPRESDPHPHLAADHAAESRRHSGAANLHRAG